MKYSIGICISCKYYAGFCSSYLWYDCNNSKRFTSTNNATDFERAIVSGKFVSLMILIQINQKFTLTKYWIHFIISRIKYRFNLMLTWVGYLPPILKYCVLPTFDVKQMYDSIIICVDTCPHETSCYEWDAEIRGRCFKMVQRHLCDESMGPYIFRHVLILFIYVLVDQLIIK
jgi:hypothetical protein